MGPIRFLIGVFLFLVFTSLGSASSPLELVHPGQLTVCSYEAFEPVIYGEGLGLEADLLRTITARSELGIQFLPIHEYEGIWKMVLGDDPPCDLIAGGLSITLKRKKDGVAFTLPYTAIQQSLLVRTTDYQKGLIDYPDFQEGLHKIGVVPGTTGKLFAIQRVRAAHKDPAILLQDYPSENELLSALRKGEVDAIARGTPGNLHQSRENKEFTVTAIHDFGERLAFAVNPKNKALLAWLNRELVGKSGDKEESLSVG